MKLGATHVVDPHQYNQRTPVPGAGAGSRTPWSNTFGICADCRRTEPGRLAAELAQTT